jgi:hypothetical protein
MSLLKIKELDEKQLSVSNIKNTDIFFEAKDCPNVKMSSILPFRVKFQNIGLGGYSPTNPAPIGIAIIGFNNYIL